MCLQSTLMSFLYFQMISSRLTIHGNICHDNCWKFWTVACLVGGLLTSFSQTLTVLMMVFKLSSICIWILNCTQSMCDSNRCDGSTIYFGRFWALESNTLAGSSKPCLAIFIYITTERAIKVVHMAHVLWQHSKLCEASLSVLYSEMLSLALDVQNQCSMQNRYSCTSCLDLPEHLF